MFYTEDRDPRTKWHGRVLKNENLGPDQDKEILKISDWTGPGSAKILNLEPDQYQQNFDNLGPGQENMNRSVPGPWQGIPFDQSYLLKRI